MTEHAKARHVLIIEDEILVAFEVEALLAEQGFTSFDIADSPADALALAMANPPDLITADYRIVGVVYVTGNADQLKGRVKPIVDKPISPRHLREACATAIIP
jgi:DNA-binding NarL/FixJ family response regulator